MASKAYVSLSAAQMSPETPSSFPGFLPIRAPLTLDDSEFDVSGNSSNGIHSESESDSEGFLSGEESETASPRPTVVETRLDQIVNACGEEEESVGADDSAPLAELPNVHDHMSLRVMPFAQLSSYDDDDGDEEEEVYEVEGDKILSVVRVRSIDVPEDSVGLPRIKAFDTQEEELETLMLSNSSASNQSSIENEFTVGNHMSFDHFNQQLSTDMTEKYVGFPRILALDDEEEAPETLMFRDSSTVDQSFNANDLTFVDHTSPDNFLGDENGVASFWTMDGILEDGVAQGEYLTATDTDMMSQDSKSSLKTEQFGKVRIASNELENEEGFKLDDIDRLEGGIINLVETSAASMNSMSERRMEVGIKETNEMVEAASIMSGDSCPLNSNIKDHSEFRMLKMNATTAHDLQNQNHQSQINFCQRNCECTEKELECCLPAQEATANGSQGLILDQEIEDEKLIITNKSVNNLEVKLHDASDSFGSKDGHAYNGNHIHSVESAKLPDARLPQKTLYLENDLEDVFSEYSLHEQLKSGLNLGDDVRREPTVYLNAVNQESKLDGSASDGDVEGLVSAGPEEFMEEISALCSLLSLKGSSQQEQTDRNSHENMNLLRDDAKEQSPYATNGGKIDCSSIITTSADESGVISVKDPASFSSSPDFEVKAGLKCSLSDKEKEKVEKILALSIKFLRLVQRINLSLNDNLVLKVLCRLVADIGRRSIQEFIMESANILAKKLEENGEDDLDFSLNIIVLGKCGVGKSATINSIFGETKARTSAFDPATASVKEVTGTIHGIKIRILDTPGLRSSIKEQAFNQKILSSIKRYMKKFPLDVILYVDRVDSQTRDFSDLPLLKSITSSLNPSIWQRAILTLTHAASTPWDDPSGFPLSYEAFVAQKSNLVQQSISQAVGDINMCQESPGFMCPCSLVENQPLCGKNKNEEFELPNGLKWRSHLLVLCISLKVLCEVSSMAGPQTLFDHLNHFFFQNHTLPLEHPLSSLMQSHAHLKFPTNWS